MAHQRQIIRDAIVTILSNASIVAADMVFSNRLKKVSVELLPAINVVTVNEESTTGEMIDDKLKRTMTAVIEATVQATDRDAIDNVMDDLADSIETAMEDDIELNSTAIDSSLTGTVLDHDEDGEVAIGRIRLTYNVIYIY